MTKIMKEDPERENRIEMEIIIDAYGEEEQAMGWYCYLDDRLDFPFTAKCIARRQISSLEIGDKVKVTGMASEDECLHEMFVKIIWGKKSLAVPISQLEAVQTDDETTQAIQDWHYWVGRGYQL